MGPEPIETTFYIPSSYIQIDPDSRLSSESCGYAPSPDELTTAPFYPDPSQRILVLFANPRWYFVINTERLLELAREWGGQTVEWCGWDQTIEIRISSRRASYCTWISGSRLFCISPSETDYGLKNLQVYDFSRASRAKNLNVIEGKRERSMSSSIGLYKLPTPCVLQKITITVGHDSIVVCAVSGPIVLSASPLLTAIFSMNCSVQHPDFHSSIMYTWYC